MQPTISTQPNTAEVNSESLQKVEALLQIPSELEAVIPGSVWATLTGDQRVELLRQHGLLEKYISSTQPENATLPQIEVTPEAPAGIQPISETNTGSVSQSGNVAPQISTAVNTLEQSVDAQQFQEAVNEVHKMESTETSIPTQEAQTEQPQIQNVEQQPMVENQPELQTEATAEAKSQVAEPNKATLQKDHNAEIAQTPKDPSEKSVPKYSGYQPSESLVNNAEHVAENGNVSDASTWAANLLQKFWMMLTGK